MDKIKFLNRIFIIAILFISLFIPLGVKATWFYHVKSPGPIAIEPTLGIFAWEGSGDLPGGGGVVDPDLPVDPDDPNLPPEVPVGENHMALIKRLIESDVGLNNSSSFLNSYIKDRIDDEKDNVASVAPTPGGNLKSLFNTTEIAKLDFMIHIHFDQSGNIETYELFTFETALVGTSAGKVVDPVYKTILINKNGQWVPQATYVGKSVSMRYDAKQGGGKNMTINPTAWEQSN